MSKAKQVSPIRFRAWDKKGRKYFVPDTLSLDNYGRVHFVTASDWNGNTIQYNLSDIFLEQGSNIQSRENREIFEGDIVQDQARIVADGGDEIAEQFAISKHARYEVIRCDAGLTLRPNKNELFPLVATSRNASGNYNDNLIVLGNIHEKPELLKEEE